MPMLLFVVMAVTTPQMLRAQGELQPAVPQGYGLNNIQITENLSSGVLNVNLPLEDFLVPVSISYTTTGIRVEQRPGVVGLGWQLAAGGFIARQKRGLCDDEQNGYSGEYKRGLKVTNLPHYNDFDDFTYKENYDAEPDIYSFHFLGFSGRFTFDANRNLIKLSPNDLKITPHFTNASGFYAFTILDTQGNKYYFSTTEYIKEFKDGTEEDNYRAKWHLTYLINYKTGKQLDFTYETGPTHSETNTFRWQRRTWTTSGNGTYHSSDSYPVKTEYKPKLLNKISNNDSEIIFTYGTRTDISTLKRLSNITYTVNGETSFTYTFQYKYMGTGTAQRLMLAGISKSSLNVWLQQFVYYGEATGEVLLPSYGSSKIDHWGFYNNNPSGSKYEHVGASRQPYLNHTKANTLKKIYNSSGGFVEYVYELNKYDDNGTDKNTGGLRIAAVYQDNGEGDRYQAKAYDYTNKNDSKSSGELYAEPLYYKKYHTDYTNTVLKEFREYSLEPLMDDLGRHISYGFITVTDADGGKTESMFYTFSDDLSLFNTGGLSAEVAKGYNHWVEGWTNVALTDPATDDGPFGYKYFKGTAVGLIEEKEVLNSTGGKISKEVYTYTAKTPTSTVMGMNSMNSGYYSPNSYDYLLSFYELGYGYMQLDKITTTAYDVNDPNKSLTTITDIHYESGHLSPIKKETYRQGQTNNKRVSTTEYLFKQSTPTAVITEVNNNNLLALASTQKALVDNTEKTKTVLEYEVNGAGRVEMNRKKDYVSGNMMVDTGFDYDNEGHLGHTKNYINDFSTSQLWDSNGQRVIATISNAANYETAFTSFEGDDPGGWTFPAIKEIYECNDNWDECWDDCMNNNPNQTCFDQCDTDYDACQSTVNVTSGLLGSNAFKLSQGSITRYIGSGTYFLISYWIKSGSVTISGTNSNTLVQTRTLDGWTLEERKISVATSGTITISSSNGAYIDHLKIHPSDAQMVTYTHHPMFGKTSETDANHNSIFYEYDALGRNTIVRDRDKDVVQYNTFNIAQYLDLSATSYSPNFHGGTKDIFVASNDTYWSVSDNANWVSVSPTSGKNVDDFVITVEFNTTTSSRNATVTMGSTLPGKTITVTQGAAPATYLVVIENQLDFDTGYLQETLDVYSTATWTASVGYEENLNDLSISSTSNTLTITCNNYLGWGWGVIELQSGGMYESIYINY